MDVRREREAEWIVGEYIAGFVKENSAAQVLQNLLDNAGIGLRPVVDHVTIRTNDVPRRAEEFVALGYQFDKRLDYPDWWANVYRKPGFPALFIDQAFAGARGRTSIIPHWVMRFGDSRLHHLAVQVTDIEVAVERLNAQGVICCGEIVGAKGGALRQTFTAPELLQGEPFSILELIERHFGYPGFAPPEEDCEWPTTTLDWVNRRLKAA